MAERKRREIERQPVEQHGRKESTGTQRRESGNTTEQQQDGTRTLSVKFVENGRVFTGNSKDEIVKMMYKAQWVSPSVELYMRDVSYRLKQKSIYVRTDTAEHFYDDLLIEGVIKRTDADERRRD